MLSLYIIGLLHLKSNINISVCVMVESLTKSLVTARKRSLGQGNIFSSVWQEFCSQGVCLCACWDTPRSIHSPEADTPGSRPPGSKHPLEADTPWKQTALRSACWEMRSTSGWYASYWNAILFFL